jgi:Leucine-rich repeat (LRR) protein
MTKVNFCFFIKESDLLEISVNQMYDFSLEADNLTLIKSKLTLLSPDSCILCQLRYMIDETVSVQLLFTSLSPNILEKIYVKDTEYLLTGTQQNFSLLMPTFKSIIKADRMIGISFISVKLLLEKITTWMNDKAKPLIILQQKLPKDFVYTQDSFQNLCARYGREPKNCALHIVYNLVPNKTGLILAEPSFDRKLLAACDIKLSIEIIFGDTGVKALSSILQDLKNTIYSLNIYCGDITLKREYYDNVLIKMPNLKILKLSHAYIKWKPFLSCIKNIKTLEELDLSEIRMLATSDIEEFKSTLCDSLRHLTDLRIAGYRSIVSYNEEDEDDLVDIILPCLKDFTKLRTFGFTCDPTYNTSMDRVIPYLQDLNNLTQLDLSGSNLLPKDQLEYLAKYILPVLPNLRDLNLSRCQLEMRTFEPIIDDIKKLQKLRSLDISDNEDFYPEDIKKIKERFTELVLRTD